MLIASTTLIGTFALSDTNCPTDQNLTAPAARLRGVPRVEGNPQTEAQKPILSRSFCGSDQA
ncbi:hypothetical protein [Spirosoma endbachense]|uniref:Uncharacterized protein n=1 Tax=Spirosoma endbachense TaxID=2666025 RepID=A0A6P1VWB7_9BACT|nr:hypothetical protein [Spirosoma endbachense]QHV95666.1 hypothetical protein GJR95_11905 [Spirosoma endbachense]